MAALQGIGILLVVLAVVAFVIWFLQNRKAGKIRTVPFKKPSEIAQQGMNAGDAKQMVSTEGQMMGQPIMGPMSGQPCVYFEVEITRHYTKRSTDSQGNSTKTSGSKTCFEQKQGTFFQITDGQGAANVDCSKSPSFDLKKSHDSRQNVGLIVPNMVQFGNLQMQTGALMASALAGAILGDGMEVTDYFQGTEKIVPFTQGQTMYALGKLSQTQWGPAIGEAGWSSLLLSDKGREATLGSAVKTAKIAMIAGAVMMGTGAISTTLGFVLAPAEAPTAEATPSATATASAAPSASETVAAATNTAPPQANVPAANKTPPAKAAVAPTATATGKAPAGKAAPPTRGGAKRR